MGILMPVARDMAYLIEEKTRAFKPGLDSAAYIKLVLGELRAELDLREDIFSAGNKYGVELYDENISYFSEYFKDLVKVFGDSYRKYAKEDLTVDIMMKNIAFVKTIRAKCAEQLLTEFPPNMARAATTWSPVLRADRNTAVTAAMPVAVARATGAPSSAAMRSSNMEMVGLPKRLY